MPLLSWVKDRVLRAIPRFMRPLPVIFLCIAFSEYGADADSLKFNSEFNYLNSASESTTKSTGETFESTFSGVKQRYDLGISKSIYPYMTFEGGAFYQSFDTVSTFSETETNIGERIIRPFADLKLEGPVLRAGIGARKTQIEEEATGLTDVMSERDEMNALLGWKPAELPEMNLRYTQIDTYNNLDTIDSTDRQLNIDSRYTVWKDLRFNYFYYRADKEDGIKQSNILEQTHNGIINYSKDFYDRRLSLNTSYRVRHNTLAFPGSLNAELPLSPSAGLSGLDNFPDEGTLETNNALINGDVETSAGLDIGLAGDETTLTNIGLDFGFPLDVDKIHLYVDRRLSSTIANSFFWEIYTSSDPASPESWTHSATIFPAYFTAIDNRFEISFPKIRTRFIKIVTRPLSSAVNGSGGYPNIFVTEMEAFNTVSGEAIQNENVTLDQNYSVNLNGKISDKTRVGYNMFYRSRKEEFTAQKRTELSNGIYLNHVFNKILSANTSLLQTDNKIAENVSHIYTYAASLRAAYFETLSQSITYSGLKETNDQGSIDKNSLVLRTNAKLYKGWDVFFDTGYSHNSTLEGITETSLLIRTGTNLVPNEKVTINSNYTLTKMLQTESDEHKVSDSLWDIQIFFTPFAALSLNTKFSLSEKDNLITTYQNYSMNWLPFPEGALQLFFVYNESLTPENNQKDRSISPSLQYKISRHANLNMAYNITTSETDSVVTDTNSFNADIRLTF